MTNRIQRSRALRHFNQYVFMLMMLLLLLLMMLMVVVSAEIEKDTQISKLFLTIHAHLG